MVSSKQPSTTIPTPSSSTKKKRFYHRPKKKKRPRGRPPGPAKPKKKRGRKKDRTTFFMLETTMVPLQFARHIVQTLGISSIIEYNKWYADNQIRYLPFNPAKTYKDWISWNDFLGNSNSFEKMIRTPNNFLPYWEGVKFAQTLAKNHHLTTIKKWREYHKANNIQEVPRFPERYYTEFGGWKVWLGKAFGAVAEVLTKLEQYLLIIQVGGGYYEFVVTKGGREEAIKVLEGKTLIKAYVWEEETAVEADTIIEKFTEDHEESTRFCQNINNIIYQLDTLLITYRG